MAEHPPATHCVSELIDGELPRSAFAPALRRLAQDAQALEAWRIYHTVGQVLRHGALREDPPDPLFVAALMDRITQEESTPGAAEDAPHAIKSIAGYAVQTGVSRVKSPFQQSANAPWWGWRMLAGWAVLALLTALAWQMLGGEGDWQPALAATDARPMLRDPQLDALLAAHREARAARALAAPDPGVRNAVFEGSSR